VRFRLRVETPGLSELLGWALSGTGLEATATGSSAHRDPAAARSTTKEAGHRALATHAAQAQDETIRALMTEAESSGPAGPIDLEKRDSQAVAGPRPTRRPKDLEDYLL
jgi:hypothetical protein